MDQATKDIFDNVLGILRNNDESIKGLTKCVELLTQKLQIAERKINELQTTYSGIVNSNFDAGRTSCADINDINCTWNLKGNNHEA